MIAEAKLIEDESQERSDRVARTRSQMDELLDHLCDRARAILKKIKMQSNTEATRAPRASTPVVVRSIFNQVNRLQCVDVNGQFIESGNYERIPQNHQAPEAPATCSRARNRRTLCPKPLLQMNRLNPSNL